MTHESTNDITKAGHASSRAYLVVALLIQVVAGTVAAALDYILVFEQRPERFSALGWLTLLGAHGTMVVTFRARNVVGQEPSAATARRRAGVIALVVGVLVGAFSGLVLAFILSLGPGLLYRGHWDFG